MVRASMKEGEISILWKATKNRIGYVIVRRFLMISFRCIAGIWND